NEPADVMIGKLKEARVDLHLTREHSLKFRRKRIPGGNLFRAHGELAVLRNHAELFLTRERLFAKLVPALVELAFVLVGPFLRDVVRRVRSTGSKIHKERLISGEQPLLPYPRDGAIRHI